MGQITRASSPGITVSTIDRETGPGAGPGTSGNFSLFLGSGSGTNADQAGLIVLGNNALAGGATGAASAGMVVIGRNAAALMTNFTAAIAGGQNVGSVVLGLNAAQTMTRGAVGSVLLGTNIMQFMTNGFNNLNQVNDNVMIGAGIMELPTGTYTGIISENVLIGAGVLRGSSTGNWQPPNRSVIIGARACYDFTGNSGLNDSVIVGYNACPAMTTATQTIAIGMGAGVGLTSGNGNIIIGVSATCTATASQNVIIGTGIVIGTGGFNNVAVGTLAPSITGSNNVFLGVGCGTGTANATTGMFLVETATGAIVYGSMSSGNCVVGKSTVAQRNVAADYTNALGLITGTRGTTNPNTGGFFYTSATGQLRWVNQAGQDQTLAGSVTTFAGLPLAASIGSRAFITDGLAPAWGVAAAGGGAVPVPVFHDGVNWKFG